MTEQHSKTKTVEAYQEYFRMPRESLYLHLNKSSFLRGENLWFQGYAYDRQTQKLSPNVRNVELGIYDNQGHMIQKKLYLSVDGLFKGQIAIDSSFADGEFYLKAETNWMKNFKEDYAHIQKFEVIGAEQQSTNQTLESYDLQILPEGGHSVVNCNGVLGFKLLNSKGLGVKFTAKIFENNKPKFSFKSNQFGLAKVDFKPQKGFDYKVEVKMQNGQVIQKTIENIKPYGYDMNVHNMLPDNTLVEVTSNMSTSTSYNNHSVKLMVHQEGKFFIIPLEFNKKDTKESISIMHEKLYYGVNTLTLFVNDKPVAERLIFNRNKSSNKNKIQASLKEKQNTDSLTLNLSMLDNIEKSFLSISVLPAQTTSYLKNQNIISALLLDPFVNGYIENKPYYFKNQNRVADYNLDLLLLTQGWSQYKWNNIFSRPPSDFYKRKDGLVQNISINGKTSKNIEKLILFPTILNQDEVYDFKPDMKTIELQRRYPIIGEKMEFSFFDKKKRFIKPIVIVGTELRLEKDKLAKTQLHPSISNLRQTNTKPNSDRLYANFQNTEMLSEVIVKAEPIEPKKPINYRKGVNGKLIRIDQGFASQYPLLSDYLRTKGFIISDNGFSYSITNTFSRSFSGGNKPSVFLDGTILFDLSILSRMRTSDFESIYVDKIGLAGAGQGATGIIRLISRRTPLSGFNNSVKSTTNYNIYKVEKGFEMPKEFYMPKYAFFKTESFQQVGTIAWFSDISISEDQTLELNIFDTGLNKVRLFIEGITENGNMIALDKLISKD